ncbi:protein serine/threonine phosphatase 2C, partial [Rhizoclosmatium globosum]
MWAAQGLGGDHRIHGHHFEDGGVVTHEYDTTWNTSNSNALANSDETKKDEMMDSSKTEDFAAMSSSSINQYDIISESGSIMSDDQEDDDDVVMDIMNSKAGSAGAVDLMETSTASSDTESTLSSTNNSSMQQHDATETLTRRANTSSKRIFPSTETSRLFILADGHGGILASKFFVPRTKAILTDLLKTQSWDFSLPQHRLDFETRACEAFRIIDAEYCAIQVSRYRTWVDAGSIPSDRPDDDGCALVAVVIHNGWIVNLNVGDSRMTLHSRPRTERGAEKQPWSQVFTSTDHNMTHPAKVYSIYTSGGHFMSPSHTLIPMNPQHPSLRGDVPYNELANARIYRHASPAVKAVGVSHRRTLNLTGTMGDLLFKIEPAVLSPVPDVSFVELDKRWEYVMVLATDGIWDHLMDNSGDTERQVSMVMGVVEAAVMSVEAERDEYERAVEGYKREKREWKRREVERRRVLREERVQRRAVVAVGEGEVAIEGVAVAAEPERVVEMEDDDDEDGEEEGSVASSNGSTAVASKDTVKSKKTGENDGDEVEEEEEEEGLGSSSEASKPKVEEAKSEQQPQALEEDEDMLMMDDEDDIVVETPSATATSAAPHTQFLPTSTKLPPPTKPALFDFHAVMEDRLRQVSEVLVEREMGKNAEGRIHPAIVKAMQHLYWQKQIRYDDATAFVAYF